jgi:hypothetical protein
VTILDAIQDEKSPKPVDLHPASCELQANMDRFVRSIGHLILMRVIPEAACQAAEDNKDDHLLMRQIVRPPSSEPIAIES